MTSTMPSSIDPHGNCVHHPFVQLQRLSPRTGEWKALLDSCPLCAMDTRSTCSSVCSSALGSVCSGLEVERTSGGASRRRASDSGSIGSGSQRGRGRAPSLEHALVALDQKEEERASRPARARSTSRVRFGGASECDVPYSKAKSTSFHVVSSPDPHNPYVVGRSSSASLSGMRDISPGAASLQGGGASVSSQSVSTRSALKAPKYKPCPKEMRRQLDESERVTTMSMDLNMSLNDDGSVEIPGEEDYPDYYAGYDDDEEQEREEERLQIEHEARQHEHEEDNEEEEEDSVMLEAKEVKKELQLPLLTASPGSSHEEEQEQEKEDQEEEQEEEELPPSRRSSTESNASGSSRRRHRSKERRSSAMDNTASSRQEQKSSKPRPQRSSSCQIGYRSDEYSQVQAGVQVSRPDPEEYPCGASLSSQDRTQPRRNGRQQRAGPPVTSSNNNGFAARQVRTGSFTSGVVPPPPPPFPTLQPTSAANRYGSTVVAQPGYDDEVSTLSFMGNSVRSESVQGSPTLPAVGHVNAHPNAAAANGNNNGGGCESHHGSDKTLGELTNPNNGESSPEASTHEPMPQVNTNDYDAKGKCKHHPHIRLRKKKLFGRGWKVLMSACPDCCVDELRRIRLVEENKRKMAAKAEARGLERGLDKSERSVGTANSGTSRASRASRKSSNKRTSSNHSVRSHGSHQSNRSVPANNGAQSNRRHSQLRSSMESHASSRVPPPPPPPRRSPSVDSTRNSAHKSVRSSSAAPTSPSHDARHEMVAKTLNKHAANKARRPSDETASLTGSSSGSSNGQSGVDASHRSSIDASLRSSGEGSIPASPGARSPSLDNVAASLNRNYQSSPMGSTTGAGPAATEKKRRASSKSNRRDSSMSAASNHSRSSQQAPPGPPRGSIHVRKMQWTDVKNGRNGQYTGQVDPMFAPHGSGIMEYDDGSSREGMWKNGRFRKSGGSSGGSVKSGRSAGSSSRSRSKGRDGGSARSRSRSAGRSVSRQPQMPVAI